MASSAIIFSSCVLLCDNNNNNNNNNNIISSVDMSTNKQTRRAFPFARFFVRWCLTLGSSPRVVNCVEQGHLARNLPHLQFVVTEATAFAARQNDRFRSAAEVSAGGVERQWRCAVHQMARLDCDHFRNTAHMAKVSTNISTRRS